MNIEPGAILALISNLATQVFQLQAQVQELEAQNASLRSQASQPEDSPASKA